MRSAFSLLTIVLILGFVSIGCSGNSPIASPRTRIIGNWDGSYRNSVVGSGIIQVNFFDENGTLKARYDLQKGEVMGTSNVSVDGYNISFLGMGTILRSVTGKLDALENRIEGELTIDYTLGGTQSGYLELRKL